MASLKVEAKTFLKVPFFYIDILIAPFYLYSVEDEWKFIAGDPLPKVGRRKPKYILHCAWPRESVSKHGWGYEERWHQGIYDAAVKALYWDKVGRPSNEQVVVRYNCLDAQWVKFKYPYGLTALPGGTWVEIRRGQYAQEDQRVPSYTPVDSDRPGWDNSQMCWNAGTGVSDIKVLGDERT